MFLNPQELVIVKLSIFVGVLSVAGSLPFGLLFGWLLARKNFPGKSILDTCLNLPMVMPPVVTGFILLMLFGKHGLLGAPLAKIGVSFAFNTYGAALASAVISFPLMVRSIRISMEDVDRGLEAAARTLGATPIKVFFTITIPLSFSGIIAGIVMSFARSLGEFGATITFVSNIPGITRTLPLAIYSQLQIPGNEMGAARLSGISFIIAFAALIGCEYFLKRNQKKKL